MNGPIISRRLLLQLATLFPLAAQAEGSRPGSSDHGIGGTGLSIAGKRGGDDQGIGGTGVFGRIQRFGSIYVNGLRIRYPRDVSIYIDGRRASIDAMRIGHVVRAALTGPKDRLQTRRIDITSEVIGRIERIGKDTLTVLSQTIDLRDIVDLPRLKMGMVVAVFGIRAADGRIVASRIEPRKQTAGFVLRGIVVRAGTNLRIGGLVVARPAGALSGHRVRADIAETAKGLKLRRIVEEKLVPGLKSGKVIVETVRENGSSEGRGFSLRSGPANGSGPRPIERSYVDFEIGPDGRPTSPRGFGPPGSAPRGFPGDRPPPPGPGSFGEGRRLDFRDGRPPDAPHGPPPGERP